MEYPEDQESVNPNLAGGRPLPGPSKRRLSLLEHGTPSRPHPKRKIKDRRRVSFAPDTELTSVHHFIKVQFESGGSHKHRCGRARDIIRGGRGWSSSPELSQTSPLYHDAP